MIGAGAQMLTPFSYQTNLMAFGSGSYSVKDFWYMGLPVVTLMGVVTVPGVMWYYGQLIPKAVLNDEGSFPKHYDINATMPGADDLSSGFFMET